MSESAVTKKIISDGFKALMMKKHFEKITISDITAQCGLNRQTFYYHFQDKYELLNWVLYTDIITPFTKDLTINNWSEKLLNILITLKQNSRFYTNAFNTSHGDEFRQYFFSAVSNVLSDVIDQLADGFYVDPHDKDFISEFLSYGVSGTVSKWIKSGMKESPEAITRYLENLINDFKRFAVTRYISRNSPYETE